MFAETRMPASASQAADSVFLQQQESFLDIINRLLLKGLEFRTITSASCQLLRFQNEPTLSSGMVEGHRSQVIKLDLDVLVSSSS